MHLAPALRARSNHALVKRTRRNFWSGSKVGIQLNDPDGPRRAAKKRGWAALPVARRGAIA
jgi:hypothetical protein